MRKEAEATIIRKITIIKRSKWSKGVYVYVHPKWISPKELDTNFGLAERYFAEWFTKIPTHCCCQKI